MTLLWRVMLQARPQSLCLNVSRRCYVQAYVVQQPASQQLGRGKLLLGLQHLRRFSSDAVKVKVAQAGAKHIKDVKKAKGNEFRRLFLLAAPEKWRLVGAIAFLVISSTVTMVVPFCLGKIIDIIYTGDKENTKDNLNNVCLILFGIFVLGGMCNFARVYLMSTTGHKITQSLRQKAYAAILSQETAMFDKVSTGELVGRLSGKYSVILFSKT